jgi:hypothetical protein
MDNNKYTIQLQHKTDNEQFAGTKLPEYVKEEILKTIEQNENGYNSDSELIYHIEQKSDKAIQFSKLNMESIEVLQAKQETTIEKQNIIIKKIEQIEQKCKQLDISKEMDYNRSVLKDIESDIKNNNDYLKTKHRKTQQLVVQLGDEVVKMKQSQREFSQQIYSQLEQIQLPDLNLLQRLSNLEEKVNSVFIGTNGDIIEQQAEVLSPSDDMITEVSINTRFEEVEKRITEVTNHVLMHSNSILEISERIVSTKHMNSSNDKLDLVINQFRQEYSSSLSVLSNQMNTRYEHLFNIFSSEMNNTRSLINSRYSDATRIIHSEALELKFEEKLCPLRRQLENSIETLKNMLDKKLDKMHLQQILSTTKETMKTVMQYYKQEREDRISSDDHILDMISTVQQQVHHINEQNKQLRELSCPKCNATVLTASFL